MAKFMVTLSLEDVDDHESEGAIESAVDSLQPLHIEIDTTLIYTPLSALLQRVVRDWPTLFASGEIKDNGKRVGTYWTESE